MGSGSGRPYDSPVRNTSFMAPCEGGAQSDFGFTLTFMYLGVHDLHQSVYLSFMYFYTFKAPLRGCARIYTPPGTLAMGRGVTPFPPEGGATRQGGGACATQGGGVCGIQFVFMGGVCATRRNQLRSCTLWSRSFGRGRVWQNW